MTPAETCRREPGARLLLLGAWLAALALGCASPAPDAPAPPPLGPGVALADALAGLRGGAPQGASLRVDELRVLRVDVDPWQKVPTEEAAAGGPQQGTQAVIAQRTCRLRRGLRRLATPRASWLLFRDARLHAFDHWSFGPGCAGEHHFRPARGDDVALERDLLRYVAQRFPDAAPSALDQVAMGHAYLGAGRLEDAEAMLRAAQLNLDSLASEAGDTRLSDTERAARNAEAAELERATASLRAEVRAARRRDSAP